MSGPGTSSAACGARSARSSSACRGTGAQAKRPRGPVRRPRTITLTTRPEHQRTTRRLHPGPWGTEPGWLLVVFSPKPTSQACWGIELLRQRRGGAQTNRWPQPNNLPVCRNPPVPRPGARRNGRRRPRHRCRRSGPDPRAGGWRRRACAPRERRGGRWGGRCGWPYTTLATGCGHSPRSVNSERCPGVHSWAPPRLEVPRGSIAAFASACGVDTPCGGVLKWRRSRKWRNGRRARLRA